MVPDPKLPTMDVYIVPKHIYETIPADEVIEYAEVSTVSAPARSPSPSRSPGPGLAHGRQRQLLGGASRRSTEIVFRVFSNADAMVAALEKGELDAATAVPASAFERLSSAEGIVTVEGQQGGFDEIALNAGAGYGKPHPSLLDVRVRQAIAHAIDKETLLDRVFVASARSARRCRCHRIRSGSPS